ncbi:MAG: hypothetical protein ACJ8AI_08050 [Rhodopila sp.]
MPEDAGFAEIMPAFPVIMKMLQLMFRKQFHQPDDRPATPLRLILLRTAVTPTENVLSIIANLGLAAGRYGVRPFRGPGGVSRQVVDAETTKV